MYGHYENLGSKDASDNIKKQLKLYSEKDNKNLHNWRGQNENDKWLNPKPFFQLKSDVGSLKYLKANDKQVCHGELFIKDNVINVKIREYLKC